jgi:hypothetical protein
MNPIKFEEGGDFLLEDSRYIALPEPISPHFRPSQVFTTHCRLTVEDTAANSSVNPGQCIHPEFIAFLITGCFLLALPFMFQNRSAAVIQVNIFLHIITNFVMEQSPC